MICALVAEAAHLVITTAKSHSRASPQRTSATELRGRKEINKQSRW